MHRKIFEPIEKFWGSYFPKRQILLKTGNHTKFFNINSSTQAIFSFAMIILLSWSIFSSLIFTVRALNLGTLEEQFARERQVYDNQISKISGQHFNGRNKRHNKRIDLPDVC